MTRQEAKKRWCPQAVVPLGTRFEPKKSANRYGDGEIPDSCRCLAEGCAVWREYLEDPTSGFCGLAGQIGAP